MSEEKKRKNPLIAIILSAILPGLGQIYVNRIPKGLILIGLNLIISFLLVEPSEKILENLDRFPEQIPDNSLLFIVCGYLIAMLVLLIYAIIDAKKTADRINMEIDNLIT